MKAKRICNRAVLMSLLIAGQSLSRAQEIQGLLAVPISREGAYEDVASPSGYLFQLNELAEPNWRDLIEDKAPQSQLDRCDSAFGLGVALADTYLCVETMDVQMIRNSSQEIQIFAQSLGLSQLCHEAWADQIGMAEEKQWVMLRTQMDSTYTGIQSRLVMQQDVDLAILVELGLWFRLYEAGCVAVLKMEEPPSDPCSLIPCGDQKNVLLAKIKECRKLRQGCGILDRLSKIIDLSPSRLQPASEIKAGIESLREALSEELGRLKQH